MRYTRKQLHSVWQFQSSHVQISTYHRVSVSNKCKSFCGNYNSILCISSIGDIWLLWLLADKLLISVLFWQIKSVLELSSLLLEYNGSINSYQMSLE